jgi:hypothetical protein
MFSTSKSDIIREKFERDAYKKLYVDADWENLENQLLSTIFVENQAVLMYLPDDDRYVVYSIHDFKVYHDYINKTTRYAMMRNGAIIRGMENLQHGVDLWHVKDPAYSQFPLAISRMDTAYRYCMLENEGVKVNVKLFKNGMINLIFMGVDSGDGKMGANFLRTQVLDPEDPTKTTNVTQKDSLLKRIRSAITGSDNANSVQIIEDLNKIHEVGKDNKSMQFEQLINQVAPKKLAMIWGVTDPDMGSGTNSTYNNVETMNFVLHDKVGRMFETVLADCANRYILTQKYGINISKYGSLYAMYQPPSDPRIMTYKTHNLNLYNADVISRDELRDAEDIPILDEGNRFRSELTARQPQFELDENSTVDATFKEATPVQKLLESTLYKGSKKKTRVSR